MAAKSNTSRVWSYRGGHLTLGEHTLLMGVVNITPDSFSDGGKFLSTQAAAEHAMRLQMEGADLLDLGAESTRPGSKPVTADEQLRRLLPVLRAITGEVTIPVSIDTTSAEVARECLETGVAIINDVSGFHRDTKLPGVCAKYQAGVVLMHIKGSPETMQDRPTYSDIEKEVREYLQESVATAERAGVMRSHIVIDPGIGFGKTFDHNYQLLGNLNRFEGLAAGVLVGPSRKAFTGEFSGLPPAERQYSTAAAVAIAVLRGADIVRVHDVKEMRQVVDIVDKYRAIHSQDSDGI